MNVIEKNGLRLSIGEINSKTRLSPKEGLPIIDWNGLWDLIREFLSSDVYLLAYLNYKVLAGRFRDKKPEFYADETFDPKFLLRLRVFNKEEELLLWKRSDVLFDTRYRTDCEGEKIDVVEAGQLIWGEVEALEPGWVKLRDKGRGMELAIPWDGPVEKGERFKIKTRNYINYSDMGQAGYTDCRLVEYYRAGGGL